MGERLESSVQKVADPDGPDSPSGGITFQYGDARVQIDLTAIALGGFITFGIIVAACNGLQKIAEALVKK